MKRNIILGLFFASIISLQSFGTGNFSMNNYSGQAGTQITIPVKVTDFNNVLSIQGTVQFDQTKLQFVTVQDYTLLNGMTISGFGTSQVTSGILTFSWMEPGMSGLTLSDSSTIFSFTFLVTGSAGQTTPLQFVNSPTLFEVIDPTMSPLSFTLTNGSVYIYSTVSIPEIQANSFQLYPNVPNPFTSETRFVFSLPEDGLVSFTVFDKLGNKVMAFEKEFMAGKRSIAWNAKPWTGTKLPDGTYFYRISCEKYSGTGKMLFIK
jgi:hypothetical protein